tara:strand:+ start:152 stop:349 length:198 start_codon:yes stop_codon:yes gene_type:complete
MGYFLGGPYKKRNPHEANRAGQSDQALWLAIQIVYRVDLLQQIHGYDFLSPHLADYLFGTAGLAV